MHVYHDSARLKELLNTYNVCVNSLPVWHQMATMIDGSGVYYTTINVSYRSCIWFFVYILKRYNFYITYICSVKSWHHSDELYISIHWSLLIWHQIWEGYVRVKKGKINPIFYNLLCRYTLDICVINLILSGTEVNWHGKQNSASMKYISCLK